MVSLPKCLCKRVRWDDALCGSSTCLPLHETCPNKVTVFSSCCGEYPIWRRSKILWETSSVGLAPSRSASKLVMMLPLSKVHGKQCTPLNLSLQYASCVVTDTRISSRRSVMAILP
ncbi:unnamed protein product [Prorocentrum cordatum]|uniref:Uncharacterized protein n=1 Tax=Prorocentrum cordatum TaxID=2364126 RepID=A0ABN9UAP7_9DINO|nr:unnamed protein product [Polarella glacialis]